MTKFSRIALVTLAAPLALAVSACGGDETTTGGAALDPVAAPEGATWDQTVSRTEQGGWLVGNPEAPIKLVEYGSLTCPACAAFSQQGSRELHEDYINSGVVSYELRSVLIHGVVDLLLTRVLECAPIEVAVPLADQIWADTNVVVNPFQANQAALEQAFNLPPEQRFVQMAQIGGLNEFFAERGLSTDQTQMCLADADAIQTLATTTQDMATEDGVTGTPTFFINGRKIDGTSWADVEDALQQAGAR